MSVYPKKIADLIARRTPAVNGCDFNGDGRAVNLECGSVAKFLLLIDNEKKIKDLRFNSSGCGFMAAAGQVLSEQFEGYNLKELRGADADGIASLVTAKTSDYPVSRKQCLYSVAEAFRNAVADHRRRVLDEFQGEKALVCTCFGLTEAAIVRVIESTDARDVTDVSAATNAGNGCGSCRMLIGELIDARVREQKLQS